MGQFMLNRIFYSLGIRMIAFLIFAGVGGIASLSKSGSNEGKHSSNPWNKDSAVASSSSGDRAGTWASSHRTGPRYETVYIDKDGVEHDKEDLKSYDPSEIVIHDRNGNVVPE